MVFQDTAITGGARAGSDGESQPPIYPVSDLWLSQLGERFVGPQCLP